YSTTSSKMPWTIGFFAAFLLWPSVNFAQVATSYSGDAMGAKGTIGGAPIDVDHHTLPSTGSPFPGLSLSDPAPPSLPGRGCVGNCPEGGKGIVLSVLGDGPESMSTADVDNLQVVIGGHTITANGFSNTATASCPLILGAKASVSSSSFVGSVNIDGGFFDSTTLFPGGMSDTQTFPLGPGGADGTVSVNQIASTTETASGGDIVMNALQIDATNGDQLVVASSHAGVTCPKAPSGGGGGGGGCPGKVTGGGVFMLGNQRQSFGFIAGTKKDGTAFGNFNYVNHGTGADRQGNIQSVLIDNTVTNP